MPKKRGQGRPVSGKNAVGRERLLATTERLLRSMPTTRVTISRVAREAKVDAALVRYYFGDRIALLVAVVDKVTAHELRVRTGTDDPDPTVALAEHIGKTVRFVRSATFMHRLMIDELAQAGTEAARARVRAMNLDLVDFYRQLLRSDAGKELVPLDPLFLHLAVLGASDFVASAEPLIRELLPAGSDMETFAAGFEDFLVKLVLDGARKR
jgi:AcrR family transcriptional regulator